MKYSEYREEIFQRARGSRRLVHQLRVGGTGDLVRRPDLQTSLTPLDSWILFSRRFINPLPGSSISLSDAGLSRYLAALNL